MVWSEGVRWGIVHAALDHRDWTFSQIAAAVVPAVSAKRPCAQTVSNILDLFEETGDVAVRGQRAGMPRAHIDALVAIVNKAPWSFLDELAAELFFGHEIANNAGNSYCPTVLCRVLIGEGFTRKKLRDLTINRNAEIMTLFTKLMTHYTAEQLLVVDETKRDNRHLKRTHGRAIRGETPLSFMFDVRGVSHSVLACAGLGGIVAYDVVEAGYCHETFLAAFKRIVGPLIQPHGPGSTNSVVLMDNAPIHEAVGLSLEEFVKSRGDILVFLPPYCPEFSPIEKMFAQVKAHIKRLQHVEMSDLSRLDTAINQITVEQAIRYFADSGYALGPAAHAEALARGLVKE